MILFEENIGIAKAVIKMSDGNRKSLGVLLSLLMAAPVNDPKDHRGALGPLLSLDEMRIYNDGIHRLFKACNENVVDMLTLLRAQNLGLLSRVQVLDASSGVFHQFAFETLRGDVRSVVPDFCVVTNCAKQGILYEREH